ncbi:MAG: polyprenyl synthetase family protein [Lachnospiraceae bacterium]|nr:polyprenyl synthetase family protein [Lachnospiraceae bacterium]
MREDFINLLIQKVNETFGIMKPYMPAEEGLQRRVTESMNYSFISGGKRIRPLFMLESYRLFGGDDLSKISPFMAAIEMIHTYSLIHDDLPAMDNDDYRRGRPTNHKMFDEATAILAGDGLLNLAFETISKAMNEEDDIIVLRRMVYANSVLANKAGIYGMIGGQMVDLMMENKNDTELDTLLFIHKHKTAALIEAALMIGAIMAGADDEEIAQIEKVGDNTGLAFQIRDDILDVIGDSIKLGKSVGSDEKNDKTTYVKIKGLEESQKDLESLSKEARDIVIGIAGKENFLSDLIEYLVNREK